ncbi:hypothetical protein [Methylobacterium sp. CM6257]
MKANAEQQARNAAAAKALQVQVWRAFRLPPGKVFGVNTAARTASSLCQRVPDARSNMRETGYFGCTLMIEA